MPAPPENADDGGGKRPDKYEAHVIGSFIELDKLLRTHSVDVGCTSPHFRKIDDRTAALLVYADLAQVEQFKAEGYAVELGDNVSQRADRLKGEIGVGDRFQGGRIAPRGFGVDRSKGGDHGHPQRQ